MFSVLPTELWNSDLNSSLELGRRIGKGKQTGTVKGGNFSGSALITIPPALSYCCEWLEDSIAGCLGKS